MTRIMLAAGVAALALTTPAASKPGDNANRDGGKDRGSHVQKQKADRAKARADRAERRQPADRRAQRAERSDRTQSIERRGRPAQSAERNAQRADRAERRAQRADRVEPRAQRVERADRRQDRRNEALARSDARGLGRNNNPVMNAPQRNAERIERRIARPLAAETRIERIANRRDRQLARMAEARPVRAQEWSDLARRGVWLDGCPPGLAKKPVACIPPGQAKKLVGQPLSLARERVVFRDLPQRLSYLYRDTPEYYYRYGNGYMYQVNRANNVISSLLPLFGLGYTVGQQFPTSYPNYYMPTAYQPFYPQAPSYNYRYASGYMYQVDPITGMIVNVDPMLGYGYGYGQMMPVSYSAYNVPYQYRPYYYDTPNYYYRYAPGAIYQVDPTTSLITAVAALLTNGLTVGQPLPAGYGVYNVPYGYRSTYYDTPDAWYRYSNGYVYRVDPRTMLVTAIVASALA